MNVGYTYRNNGTIKDYWPDNTDSEMYFEGDSPLDAVVSIIEEKFGSLQDVTISAEYIHTRCLTYDMYDPFDYTCFIVARKS